MKAIYPKTTSALVSIRKIYLAFFFPTFAKHLRHVLIDKQSDDLEIYRLHVHRYQTTIDTQISGFIGFHNDITGPTFYRELEERI